MPFTYEQTRKAFKDAAGNEFFVRRSGDVLTINDSYDSPVLCLTEADLRALLDFLMNGHDSVAL